MSAAVRELSDHALELNLADTLRPEDHEEFTPLARERIATNGAVNLLLRVDDLRGWSPAELWEELAFDVEHYSDVSRLAIVGRVMSADWMATLSRPFPAAEVEYFPERKLEQARAWVNGAASISPTPEGMEPRKPE